MNYLEEIDYSSISSYLECPRSFYFRYIKHLQPLRPNINLIFGSCWHFGLEGTFKRLMAGESLSVETATEISIAYFRALWDEEAAPYFDAELTYPKSPGRAHDMYYKYWERFLSTYLDPNYKIIGVEVPFAISIFNINYIGRMDLACVEPGDFIVITDHKTAKSVNKATQDSFDNSLQTEGYLTAAKIYWDKLPRINYSVALCQKTKIDFPLFQYTKSDRAVDRFLFEMSCNIKDLHKDLALMEIEATNTDSNFIPTSFRRNPGYACTSFFSTCPYFDICKSRNNPYTFKDCPSGYLQQEWKPADLGTRTDQIESTIIL